jgi:hypothetical protein
MMLMDMLFGCLDVLEPTHHVGIGDLSDVHEIG